LFVKWYKFAFTNLSSVSSVKTK